MFRCFLCALLLLSSLRPCCATSFTYTTLKDQPFTDLRGISDSGLITGAFSPGGALYSSPADLQRLSLGLPVFSSPTGVNDSGTVAGTLFAGEWQEGFVRKSDGSTIGFSTPNGASVPHGSPYLITGTHTGGINDSGLVAGYFDSARSETSGFLWSESGGLTPWNVPGATSTRLSGVNADGIVVGQYSDSTGVHAFFASTGGVVSTISALGGNEWARAISDNGIIAGSAGTAGWTGFYRDPDGSLSLLMVPGSEITTPYGVNSSGVVVGSYSNDGVVFYGFVATPTPEPASLRLCVVGILAAGLWRIRRVQGVLPSKSHDVTHGVEGTQAWSGPTI